jgi:hypothetical protein
VYLEIEQYARAQKPELFLYEVIEEAWELFKATRLLSIYINGKSLIYKGSEMSYDQCVQLAWGIQANNLLYTITYRSPDLSGTLCPNQVVKVCPQMVFNVVYTGNA